MGPATAHAVVDDQLARSRAAEPARVDASIMRGYLGQSSTLTMMIATSSYMIAPQRAGGRGHCR